MRKSTAGRLVGFVGAVGVTTALIASAAGSTGAYFSDSRSGAITGTTGSIKVIASGGAGADNLSFDFANMLPGDLKSATASYLNTGKNTQDVWLVFNNTNALHGLNQLGSFGEVHVASNGTEIFASNNLNDNTASCPPGESDATHGPCNALPQEIKLASNVAPGLGGNFTFSFGYSAKLKGAGAEEKPLVFDSTATDPAATGLPYQIVATQQGITPHDVNNTPNNLGH